MGREGKGREGKEGRAGKFYEEQDRRKTKRVLYRKEVRVRAKTAEAAEKESEARSEGERRTLAVPHYTLFLREDSCPPLRLLFAKVIFGIWPPRRCAQGLDLIMVLLGPSEKHIVLAVNS